MKKALLIGINYVGTENELNGCINDVKNMKTMLIDKLGYKSQNITMLTDETTKKPTKSNILKRVGKKTSSTVNLM